MYSGLPKFDYHPDPLATGSVVPSDLECECCEVARGYTYAGPLYAEAELEAICPWCIADGRAHAELGASFTDEEGIGGYGEWEAVPPAVIAAVAYRTPGFSGWQQEQWWTHCGDAAEFLGRMGLHELEALGAGAVAAIRESAGLHEADHLDAFMAALEKDASPSAYIFRCRKCGKFGGYSDCD
jgi:uncharacterized protein CbrC (UPF0167 family)